MRLAQEAAKESAARLESDFALSAEARSEVPLLVEEFRGRTRQEQAQLVKRGVRALDRNDVQTAAALRRAAAALRVNTAELDDRLVQADPQRQAAKAELEGIERLVIAWHGDVARRGMPLPTFGLYRMDILADGRMEHQINFRVIPARRPWHDTLRPSPERESGVSASVYRERTVTLSAIGAHGAPSFGLSSSRRR